MDDLPPPTWRDIIKGVFPHFFASLIFLVGCGILLRPAEWAYLTGDVSPVAMGGFFILLGFFLAIENIVLEVQAMRRQMRAAYADKED